MPAVPDMVGTVLRKFRISLFQRCHGRQLALGGALLSRAISLTLRSSIIVRTCLYIYIAQPRTNFCVLQVASPLRSFLRNICSSCAVLYSVFGGKSSLMARNRCCIICHLSSVPPCTIPMKSSRYTLTCARAMDRACRDRASQFLPAASVESASSAEVCCGMFSSRLSTGCGGAVFLWERVSSVQYLSISLVEQKKAMDSIYPMGIDK